MTITFGSPQANAIVAHDKGQIAKYGRIVHRSIYNHPIGGTAVLPEPLTSTAVAPAPEPLTSTAVIACAFCPKPARSVWQRDKVRYLCGRCFWNRLTAYMRIQQEDGGA